MRRENFTFKGSDDLDVFVYKWFEENTDNIKGIVQIAHGMAEEASRYEYFAQKLVENGYIVYANDHRGHGKTAKTLENVGYLGENKGFELLVKDMHSLTNIIKSENNEIPIYLFGHSMGSFASQMYIMEYGDLIEGLILSGSNGSQGKILNLAEIICKNQIKKYGRKAKSELLDNLIFGSNNKLFKPTRTQFDWLSRDEKEVDKYIENQFCGTLFTCGFFYDFIQGLKFIEDKNNFTKINQDLPIFIFSGDKDPVGKNGKGILKLKDRYMNIGCKDIEFRLYKDGRHEMLNELNKDEVIDDVIKWLNKSK